MINGLFLNKDKNLIVEQILSIIKNETKKMPIIDIEYEIIEHPLDINFDNEIKNFFFNKNSFNYAFKYDLFTKNSVINFCIGISKSAFNYDYLHKLLLVIEIPYVSQSVSFYTHKKKLIVESDNLELKNNLNKNKKILEEMKNLIITKTTVGGHYTEQNIEIISYNSTHKTFLLIPNLPTIKKDIIYLNLKESFYFANLFLSIINDHN